MKRLLISLLILANTGLAVPAETQFYEPPNEAKLQYNLGIDYYKTAQYDRAMAAFRQAINIDPNYIDAYYNLGSILEYLKQDDAALAVFKQIIVRKPDDYESVYKAAATEEARKILPYARDWVRDNLLLLRAWNGKGTAFRFR